MDWNPWSQIRDYQKKNHIIFSKKIGLLGTQQEKKDNKSYRVNEIIKTKGSKP